MFFVLNIKLALTIVNSVLPSGMLLIVTVASVAETCISCGVPPFTAIVALKVPVVWSSLPATSGILNEII